MINNYIFNLFKEKENFIGRYGFRVETEGEQVYGDESQMTKHRTVPY